MLFFLERLDKISVGCSFSFFDDQKGNTDSKHATNSFVCVQHRSSETKIEGAPQII